MGNADAIVTDVMQKIVTNPPAAIYAQLPKELVSDKEIVFTRDGNAVRIYFDKKGPVVVRSNLAQVMSKIEQPSNTVVQSVAVNIKNYQEIQRLAEYTKTPLGRMTLINMFKSRFGTNSDKNSNKVFKDVMTDLQKGIAKTDPSIKKKPYVYWVNNLPQFHAMCSANRIATISNVTIQDLKGNRDMIAAAMAHEMGHGETENITSKLTDQANIEMGMSMLGFEDDFSIMKSFMDRVRQVGVGKATEMEADDVSFKFLINGGFNIGATAALWQGQVEKGVKEFEDTSLEKIVLQDEHPSNQERRDNFVKKLTDYSNGHVVVKDGTLYVDGELLFKPANSDGLSGAQRAYFAMGVLAEAYHNGTKDKKFTVNKNKVMLDGKVVLECVAGDESPQQIAARWDTIQKSGHGDWLGAENVTIGKPLSSIGYVPERVNPRAQLFENLNQYQYMIQYSEDGKVIQKEGIQSVKGVETIMQFSKDIKQVMKGLSEVSVSTPEYEAGVHTGQYMVELLEKKNTVDFFNILEKEVELYSRETKEGIDYYRAKYIENPAKAAQVSEDVRKQEEKYKDKLMSRASAFKTKGNGNKSKELVREEDTPIKSFMPELGPYSGIFFKLAESRENPEFQKGISEVFAGHPKAMENYDKIIVLQNRILGNLEKLRLDLYGESMKLNDVEIENLRQGVKEAQNLMQAALKLSDDSAMRKVYEERLEKATADFVTKSDCVQMRLEEADSVLNWMIRSNQLNYKVAEKKVVELQSKNMEVQKIREQMWKNASMIKASMDSENVYFSLKSSLDKGMQKVAVDKQKSAQKTKVNLKKKKTPVVQNANIASR